MYTLYFYPKWNSNLGDTGKGDFITLAPNSTSHTDPYSAYVSTADSANLYTGTGLQIKGFISFSGEAFAASTIGAANNSTYPEPYNNSVILVGLDTSSLSNYTINGGTLSIPANAASFYDGLTIDVYTSTVPDSYFPFQLPLNSANFGPAYNSAGTKIGSIVIPAGQVGTPQTLAIPAQYINKTGRTKFLLKTAATSPPSGYAFIGTYIAAAYSTLSNSTFILSVDYTPPAAPDPPTGVSIGSVTASTAILTATPPANVGSGVSYYKVYVNNVSRVDSVAPYFPFTISGLASSTDYSVQVSLVDSSGLESLHSSTVTFTTQASGPSPSPPTAPQNVAVAVGASSDSVKVTWAAPATTNGTLINYTITNKVTSAVQTLAASASPLAVTFNGLTYGTAYTFGVFVNNSAGNSPETISASITLVAPPNVPSEPTNVVVTVVPSEVTLTWEAPTSTGGSPLTYYAINLYDSTSGNSYEPKATVAANVFSYKISGLISGHSYYFTVIATNSTSEPRAYGPPGLSIHFDPGATVSGKVLVKNSFNYVKFYEAPVVLDSKSPNYEEFLYPETVTQTVPSLISNENLVIPLQFSDTLNAIAINYQGIADAFPTPYYIPLNLIVYTDLYTLIEELQAKTNTVDVIVSPPNGLLPPIFIPPTRPGVDPTPPTIDPGGNDSGAPGSLSSQMPFEVLSLSDEVSGKNTIIFRALYPTKLFALTSEDPVINGLTYTNANDKIFSTTPTLFEGYEEPLVENHIPVPAYDNLHYKSLVESMVILSRKNLSVPYKLASEPKTYPYVEDDGSINIYKLTVDNVPLRPKTVDVFWFNETNQYTHLVDYGGDGILLEKIKNVDEFGNITYTYEPNTENGYGVIDYAQGTISQLILKDYRHASILGVGAKFPVTVGANAFLSLKIRGAVQDITIASGVYTAQSLVYYLNNLFEFTSYQLTAGYQNGQVFILNNLSGPNQELSTKGTTFGSLTIPFFGFEPIETPPPILYITYSYSLNQSNKNQYIWYQTPHFIIRVNNQAESSLFTTAHLNYILEKTAQLRPITTVLNSINLNSTLSETATVSDALDVLVYPKDPLVDPPLTYPYIIVDIMPPLGYGIPDFPMIDPYDITVTNPDNQSDTAYAAWTYVL
jgi:hypothetical protein